MARERPYSLRRRLLPITRRTAPPRPDRRLELAALPTALEWRDYVSAQALAPGDAEGWERFLVDATLRLQHDLVTMARQIRVAAAPAGKARNPMLQYNSDGYVWGEETKPPSLIAREGLGWYLRHAPPLGTVPSWARFVLTALKGAYLTLVRLGLELDQIKRTGYALVNVSATQDPARFDGTEVVS